MKTLRATSYTNKETGEIIEADKLIINYDTEEKKSYSRIKKGQNKLIDLFGRFIFLHYGKVLKINLGTNYLFRFILLSTYVNYKDNKLMKTERTPLKEKDLKDILKLSKSEYSKTMNALKSANLLYIENDLIYINKEYVSKGKITKRGKVSVDDEFSKIFIEGVRNLYNSVSRKEDKHIGVVFKLLPYVNKYYNILCDREYINYDVLSDIKPLKTSEIGKLLNLGRKKTLETLMLSRLDDMPVFLGVIKENTTLENIHYYINPCLYYQGSADNEEALKFLCEMFKVKVS